MKRKLKDHVHKCTQKSNIQLNGQALENLEYFKYSGASVENYGRTKKEMERRVA